MVVFASRITRYYQREEGTPVGVGDKTTDTTQFLLGNEVIALAAIEAGVQYAAGYPGTPSSEIIQTLVKHAKAQDMYVEWSTNEKVATEGAAAAAVAGLRSVVSMGDGFQEG